MFRPHPHTPHAQHTPLLLQSDMPADKYPQNPLPKPNSAQGLNAIANLAQMAQAAGARLLLFGGSSGLAWCGGFGSVPAGSCAHALLMSCADLLASAQDW